MDNTKYLLDTNVLISIIKGHLNVIEHIERVTSENCYVSEISIAELFYGAYKSKREKNFKDIEDILDSFEVVPIQNCLKLYGEIKTDLEAIGQRLDEFDLLIGASALVNGFVMVTANEKHFCRIPNLKVENWEKD